MADSKLNQLLLRLHARTQQGKVPWEQSVDEGEFHASFREYSISISRQPTRHPETDPDTEDIVLQVFNQKGDLIEEVDDTDFKKEDLDGVWPFKLLGDIHAMARRTAMGVDIAINSLLDNLADE